MNNKFLTALVIGLLVIGAGSASYAMICCAQAEETKANTSSKAINAGNTICPISGEPVDNQTTYEYKGKIYNFCCPACIPAFKKTPEKYIAKAGQESGTQGSMPEGHHHH